MKKLTMKKLFMSCHILTFILLSVSYSCKRDEPDNQHIFKDRLPENVRLSDYSNASITAAWTRAEDAAAYTVQLVGSRDSELPIDAYTTVSQDVYRFDNLDEIRGYYVRVRANFETGTSEWAYIMNGQEPARIMPKYGFVDEDFEEPEPEPEPITDIYPGFPEDWDGWVDGHSGTYPTSESPATYSSGEYMILRWNTNSGSTIARRSGNAFMSQSNQNSIFTMNFDLPDGASKLSFYLSPATENDIRKGDFVVEYSQDGGDSWTELARYQQSPDNQTIPWSRDMDHPANYKEFELDIEGNVRFRFSALSAGAGAGNNPGSRWAIDDIEVYQNLD